MRQLKWKSVRRPKISKQYFSQHLKSGEADASPVPRPLHTFEETISTPTENAITNLWEAMAAKFIQTPEASSSRPRVKPVMALWKDSEATTKAVLNKDLVSWPWWFSVPISFSWLSLFDSTDSLEKLYRKICRVKINRKRNLNLLNEENSNNIMNLNYPTLAFLIQKMKRYGNLKDFLLLFTLHIYALPCSWTNLPFNFASYISNSLRVVVPFFSMTFFWAFVDFLWGCTKWWINSSRKHTNKKPAHVTTSAIGILVSIFLRSIPENIVHTYMI